MILLFFKYLSEYMSLIIHAYIKRTEKVVTLGGIIILVTIIVLFAKNITDIIFGILGTVTVVLMLLNQGISKNGILRYVRYGKTLIKWDDIKVIEIKESTMISVTVLQNKDSECIELLFDKSKGESIKEIFGHHSVPYCIKTNSLL